MIFGKLKINTYNYFQAVQQDIFIVNDIDLARELFSKDVFSQRDANYFIKNFRLFEKGKIKYFLEVFKKAFTD